MFYAIPDFFKDKFLREWIHVNTLHKIKPPTQYPQETWGAGFDKYGSLVVDTQLVQICTGTKNATKTHPFIFVNNGIDHFFFLGS